MNDISVAEISRLLRREADSLARALLPRGSYDAGGKEWKVTGSNSPTGEAISVHVGPGAKQGVCGFWNGARKGGDLIDLIEIVSGLDKRQAVAYAKRWLGLQGSNQTVTPTELAKRSAADEAIRKASRNQEIKDRQRRLSSAVGIWESSTPICGPAASYLRARGIDPAFADESLRAHPGLPHPEGGIFPALVARVDDVDGAMIGLWRIFLKFDGSGKAPVKSPKLGLGNVAGGAVRLGGVGACIGVAEGIETALACRQMLQEILGHTLPVWPLLSTSGVRSFQIPFGVERLCIFADGDALKFHGDKLRLPAGLAAAEELAKRAREIVDVRISTPPAPLDWLDVLNMGQRHESARLRWPALHELGAAVGDLEQAA